MAQIQEYHVMHYNHGNHCFIQLKTKQLLFYAEICYCILMLLPKNLTGLYFQRDFSSSKDL